MRSRIGRSPCISATTANAMASGPIQIGQVRNAATPKSAKSGAAPRHGCSSHTIAAHHMPSANSSLATCAKYDCSVNDPIE